MDHTFAVKVALGLHDFVASAVSEDGVAGTATTRVTTPAARARRVETKCIVVLGCSCFLSTPMNGSVSSYSEFTSRSNASARIHILQQDYKLKDSISPR